MMERLYAILRGEYNAIPPMQVDAYQHWLEGVTSVPVVCTEYLPRIRRTDCKKAV